MADSLDEMCCREIMIVVLIAILSWVFILMTSITMAPAGAASHLRKLAITSFGCITSKNSRLGSHLAGSKGFCFLF